jgi:hypothetical protein
VFAVGDSALDAAAVVGGGAEPLLAVSSGLDHKQVVVLAAPHPRAREAAADLEPLRGRNGEHGVGEHGLELVEAGLAQARRHVTAHARHHASNAVLVSLRRLNDLRYVRVRHVCVVRVV